MKFKIEDYIGKTLWGVTVIGKDCRNDRNDYNHWIFKCNYCGKEFSEFPSRIISGHKKSCGCQRQNGKTTHGCNGDEFYHTWYAMMQRCYNPDHHNYKRYGARGITVCEEWHSPNAFIQWAHDTIGEKQDGITLDRIDNDKGYSPENCKWSSLKEQARNRSSNRIIRIDGVEKPLVSWCDDYGIDPRVVHMRINSLGWDIESAIKTPLYGKERTDWKTRIKYSAYNPGREISINGEIRNVTEWCKIFGTDRGLAYQRMQRGWDPEKAIKTPKNTDRGSWLKKKPPREGRL